jgi:PPK2 family polyphosphate:nucleotide phosphotransferase
MRSHRIRPGTKVRLARIDPGDTGPHDDEKAACARLARDIERLAKLQDVLYAEHRRAVLVVLQGMDTSGKDGTVKHVMSGVNPSGCQVVPFKVPNEEEAAHDFLWRVHRATPRHGHITIFNRSHYEDVIVPFVHRTVRRRVLNRRYAQINDFERLLAENDTLVLKFFLHISKREQRRRLLERLADPRKRWKFSETDVKERRLWPRYMKAYERLLTRCSSEQAPWYVIPSDRKWYRNLAVASVLVEAIASLGCQYPRPKIDLRRLRF